MFGDAEGDRDGSNSQDDGANEGQRPAGLDFFFAGKKNMEGSTFFALVLRQPYRLQQP